MKKIPLRRCVVTKEQLPKSELISIVKNKEHIVFLDLIVKANGRGAYIKRDISVLETARKKKILEKALEISIPEEVYDEIENEIKNK